MDRPSANRNRGPDPYEIDQLTKVLALQGNHAPTGNRIGTGHNDRHGPILANSGERNTPPGQRGDLVGLLIAISPTRR